MKCNLTCRIVFSAVVGVAACAGAAPPVDEYIDYVGVDGSQKVVLDYVPCSNTVVEAKVDVSSTTKNHCIFCARGNNNNTRTYTLFMLKGTDGWRFDYNNSNSNKSKVVPTPGTPTILRTTCEGLYVDGAKKTTYSLANFVSDNKMSLFFSYNAAAGAVDSAIVGGSNSGNEANMKVYYIKIWDDNGATLKYDLRPWRDENLVPCLRDEGSGEKVYPYSAATPFGGPALEWWEDVADDPAVFASAGTYTNGFRGTGSNVAVFKGSARKTFVGDVALSGFSSVTIEDGQLRGQKNGLDIFSGDISLETAQMIMNAPKTEADAAWTMYAATNGAIRFGADSVIGVHHIKHTSSYSSTFHLGRLLREDQGGTLLFSALCNNGNYFGCTYLGSKCRFFPAGFSDGETLPAYMVGGSWVATSFTVPMSFLKYTSSSGIVTADTTAFADAVAGDIARIGADIVLDADKSVKAIQFDGAYNLTIPEGNTLSVGDGMNQAGVIFYPRGAATNFVDGAGTLDFGAAQGIFWIGNSNNRSTIRFGNVSIKGSGGMVFSGRHGGSRGSLYAPAATNWCWSGSTYVDSSVLSLTDPSLSKIDCDIYVRGSFSSGAGLYASGIPTLEFNGKMSFVGAGDGGLVPLGGSVPGYPSFYRAQSWSDNATVKFNGGVEVNSDVQFVMSRNQYAKTNLKHAREMIFASSVSGEGNVLMPFGSGDFRFQAKNTYSGTTLVACESWLYVEGEGTLGMGDVVVTNAWGADSNTRSDMAKIIFSGKADYAMGNAFSGDGMIELRNSSLVFSNDVSVGRLKFDANSSAAFGGVVAASSGLVFPAGAEMSALAGATPALAVTNGTVFAGMLRDIDISCDGVITNRGTLAVAHIGANKRLDPIVIDGDAVFENATFEISGIADAMGGTHTVLSVTGAVEGEPTFSFPEGKVYAVTRTGNDWSIEKKAGLVLFVR